MFVRVCALVFVCFDSLDMLAMCVCVSVINGAFFGPWMLYPHRTHLLVFCARPWTLNRNKRNDEGHHDGGRGGHGGGGGGNGGGGGGGGNGGNFNNFNDRDDQQNGGDFNNDQSFNTYGLSASFLDSLGIQGPLHTKVFVANVSICPSAFLSLFVTVYTQNNHIKKSTKQPTTTTGLKPVTLTTTPSVFCTCGYIF